VALYALLRFKMLIAANGHTAEPGWLMVGIGGVSILISAFMLYRRNDIKRLFAYSSIEHMGIITFAFGIGGPLANFAGLLHMTMHSLIKSAIFFVAGMITQASGTKHISDIRGLTASEPLLGWAFVICVLAISGLPPLGIFTSEFLIISSTFASHPLLALPVVIGLLAAFGAFVLRLQGMVFGDPSPLPGWQDDRHPGPFTQAMCFLPVGAHLLLALVAGVYLPGPLAAWFTSVAKLLG
jgi:hydrogenase-4 component F